MYQAINLVKSCGKSALKQFMVKPAVSPGTATKFHGGRYFVRTISIAADAIEAMIKCITEIEIINSKACFNNQGVCGSIR